MRFILFVVILGLANHSHAQLSIQKKTQLDSISTDICNCFDQLMASLNKEVKDYLIGTLNEDPTAKSKFQVYMSSLDSMEVKRLSESLRQSVTGKGSDFERCMYKTKDLYSLDSASIREGIIDYMMGRMRQMGDCKYFCAIIEKTLAKKK